MRVSRRATIGIVAVVVVIVAAVAAVAGVVHRQSPTSQASRAVEGYLSDWSAGRYSEMAAVAEQPVPSFTAFYQASAKGLAEQQSKYDLVSVQTGANPSATFRAQLTLPTGYPAWTYTGTLPLVKRGSSWHVAWTPAALHPVLKAGEHLALVRQPQTFGHVLDRRGQQIASADPQLAQTVIGRAPSDAPGSGLGPAALHVRMASTLDGRAPAAVEVVSAAGSPVTRLQSLPGKPGADVRTTLDLSLQKTAESVASGSGKPASV